ncbi:MAG: NAD-dependent epimerase/dehydratase family protein [Verrucomicrobia bacterium]|nr:NAD-dependent epimerase/dehydratase family protein [Verrucomicrobiota bacterium]
MKILLTGGAGFIGSHLAKRLLADGAEVLVADDLSTGRLENVPEGARFLKVNLARPESLRQLPEERFDAVTHLAGQSSGEKSFDDPDADLAANGQSTSRLCRWAIEHRIRTFLYASSMSVYGQVAEYPVPETAAPCPCSYYGASKLYGESACRIASASGLRTVCFRMFNVYGPGQNLANLKQGMVSIYLAYLLQDKPVLVKGSVERVRDFIYVSDVVAAWQRALVHPVQGVFNLGSGVPTSVATLLRMLLQAAGKDSDYPVEIGPDTPGDQRAICAEISAIRKALEWEPKVSLDQGLREMVHWGKSRAAEANRKNG